jgi:hypothetical protein
MILTDTWLPSEPLTDGLHGYVSWVDVQVQRYHVELIIGSASAIVNRCRRDTISGGASQAPHFETVIREISTIKCRRTQKRDGMALRRQAHHPFNPSSFSSTLVVLMRSLLPFSCALAVVSVLAVPIGTYLGPNTTSDP